MATIRGRMVTYFDYLLPWSQMTIWSYFCVRSRDELDTSYLNYNSVYGHKTWHDDNLPSVTFTHKVTWPYNYVVL